MPAIASASRGGGYPETGTRKRAAAEHRAARTGYALPPPNGRSIAAHMSIDAPADSRVASWVSSAWRTTGESLAMVQLSDKYAAAATAAERALAASLALS